MNADDSTSPDWERRELLPGPSTYDWSSWGVLALVGIVVGAFGTVTCAVTIAAREQSMDTGTACFLTVFLISSAILLICSKAMQRKERREIEAGYTTSMQGNYEVERRHSPTGVIMRAAGQDPLSREQERRAKERVRAYLSSQRSKA